MKCIRPLALTLSLFAASLTISHAAPLKLHSIFASHMVLQRNKPIVIWGWADAGDQIVVNFGNEQAKSTAAGNKGRWEVTFPAREASTTPVTLLASTGEEKVALEDIVIGDVWVMTGQSNMSFALKAVQEKDTEAAQAHLPLLRFFSIAPNEQASPQDDIPAEKIETQGWAVSTPETCLEFSAIGYVFGARLQRSLGIPIGLIKSSRGGASIEAIVPSHKFEDDPLAKRYADYMKQKMAEFDQEAASLQIWNNQLARAKSKKLPEEKWPTKPIKGDNLTSWNIPGMSPSDMGSVHHGMFGVFKGFNIKGVLFHQGFNNALDSNCRPKRYRTLMKLMVEGWREDFHDPALPVGVIGFCAGGDTQTVENFETKGLETAPYIREAQRLGLADAGDPVNTAYLPGDDIQIPGLHPIKKCEHGARAARWALSRIYKSDVEWDSAKLVSSETQGDVMVLKFDKSVMPDDWSPLIEGFSIAGEDGKYAMAYARFPLQSAKSNASNARGYDTTTIRVWSPLVKEPKAVRYSWASSPLGNLKVSGNPALPLQNFRTDSWDYPEVEDPTTIAKTDSKKLKEEATARTLERRIKEGEMIEEVLEKLNTLTAPLAPAAK